jgi:hypothetical protein
MARAATWISRSLTSTPDPEAERMAIVISPRAAEAVKASQRARRTPRQGVRAS